MSDEYVILCPTCGGLPSDYSELVSGDRERSKLSAERDRLAAELVEARAERGRLREKLSARNASIGKLNLFIGWNATNACSGEDSCWCDAHAATGPGMLTAERDAAIRERDEAAAARARAVLANGIECGRVERERDEYKAAFEKRRVEETEADHAYLDARDKVVERQTAEDIAAWLESEYQYQDGGWSKLYADRIRAGAYRKEVNGE